MLTLKPTPKQRRQLIDNILAVYDRATPAQRESGMNWYTHAHQLAEMVGQGDVRKGAGIIAALSANTSWKQNLSMALEAGAGNPVKGLPLSLSKANRIMQGEAPAAVLGKGQKTQSFYRNIYRPNVSGPVTIDRHAHDIARGEVWGDVNRGLSTPTRYDLLVNAYRVAAAARHVRPHQMQAVTWEVWRSEIAGTSTRGKKV